jgi:hypothetical protein
MSSHLDACTVTASEEVLAFALLTPSSPGTQNRHGTMTELLNQARTPKESAFLQAAEYGTSVLLVRAFSYRQWIPSGIAPAPLYTRSGTPSHCGWAALEA